MKNIKYSPNVDERQGKYKNYNSELKTIFEYLQEHTATASMVSKATGVPHKNICRYKRDLEKLNRLWETEKKICKCTGFKAWYLTTNLNNNPNNN